MLKTGKLSFLIKVKIKMALVLAGLCLVVNYSGSNAEAVKTSAPTGPYEMIATFKAIPREKITTLRFTRKELVLAADHSHQPL